MDIQAENKKEFGIPKSAMAIFSVASVLFSAHAGGGFATGNQENTYFVSLGWSGIISLVLAMFLLTMTMREAMIMYNKFNLKSHKQLFEKLYHPFDKLEILFEVFFDIMVVMAVAAAVSGAASALQQYLGWNYYVNIVIVGAIILSLTIFGAGVVRKASTYMGIAIMFCVLIIYIVGIRKAGNFGTVMSASFAEQGFSQVPHAIGNAFTYAGFQCVTLPTMLACGAIFSGNKNHAEAKSMTVSFIMNTIALGAGRNHADVLAINIRFKRSRHGFADSDDIEIDAYGLDDGNLRHHVDSLLNVNRRYDDVCICFTF